MSSEILGGGVMVAVAAALWVTYLMPTWSRRRQFVTTERNAVRLQQTLRILAETSEVPQQVRLEANARTVVTQRKLLAQAEDDARAEAKAVTDAAAAARRSAAAQAAASRPAARTPVLSPAALRLRRLRRVRAMTSLVLLLGIILLVSGVFSVAAGGAWTLPLGGAATSALALGALSRLARTARRSRLAHAARDGVGASTTASVVGQVFEPVQLDATPIAAPGWTPRPLPRPLHLSRGSVAQAAMASADAAAELRQAATEAELARRAAQLAVAVTPLKRPAAARAADAATSRFAAMGVVGDTAPGMSDLDAVLRRRRAVG
jgi:hypothetical protein